MIFLKYTLVAVLFVVLAVGGYAAGIWFDLFGEHLGPGVVTKISVPGDLVDQREETRLTAARALGAEEDKQILFGDLHVHTTYSTDAFTQSLPLNSGAGVLPTADACDFARYCSALDFWSTNDHAEALTPRAWKEIKRTVRQCNAVAGNPENPDLVTFLGWEWSQTGFSPQTHYGHKNVVLKETAEDRVPTRPIGSITSARMPDRNMLRQMFTPADRKFKMTLLDWPNREIYYDFFKLVDELVEVPNCPTGVPTRELPANCVEGASTPRVLFDKLDEWGVEAVVIPHGNAWGLIAPPGASWDKQLANRQHDPKRQTMIEIYSGHGNSEEFRNWREVILDEDGKPHCPAPSEGYTPSCWRAGEIIRERCNVAGLDPEDCEERSVAARFNYVAAGNRGFHAVPGQVPEDWMDAGQCRDCFLPAFNLRPRSSVQYALAVRNFDDPQDPKRFRFAIMGSSDIHRARPGVGYKEFARHGMSDATGPRDAEAERTLGLPRKEPLPRSEQVPANLPFSVFGESERRAGYLTTGGLIAVHSSGRQRENIWQAIERKETYATSGPRLLLWFDLLNGPEGEVSMGSDVAMAEAPRFRVHAAGSFKQKPGCPEYSLNALGPVRLEKLCLGECYNPSDQRHLITRIEVVRIRPQIRPGEPVGELIEVPWRTFHCTPDPDGCTVEFEDREHEGLGRDTVYYVRAIQEPTPKVNGGNLRCEIDEDGNCIKMDICFGGYQTDRQDDCLAPVEERAWSSPIFVDYAGG